MMEVAFQQAADGAPGIIPRRMIRLSRPAAPPAARWVGRSRPWRAGAKPDRRVGGRVSPL